MEKTNVKVPAGAREKLPFWFGAAWSGRSVSLAVCTTLIGYTTFYSTDVLGLDPVLIGFLLMASKVFDGITDLMIGFIIDRTNTRWGKARPYEIGVIFLWIFSVMLFCTPSALSQTAKAIWVFVMYTLVNAVCFTMLYGNEAAYLIRAVKTDENRTKLTAVSGIYILLFSTVAAVIIPQGVKAAGTIPSNWIMLAVIVAIPCVLIGILRFIFIKEIKVDSQPVKLNIREGITTVGKNKYIWMLAAMYFCYHLANNVSGTVATYYGEYVYGDIGIASILSLAMILVPVFLIFIPQVMGKIGTAKTLRVGFVIMIAGYGIRTLGGTNLITLFTGNLLSVVGYVPIAFMLNVYLFECMDYGYWKTGKRVEAMMNSITSFVAKLGSAFASGGVGLLLGMVGYNGSLDVQPGSAITAIIVSYNIIPMVIIIIAVIISTKYDVEKYLPEIRREIAATEKGTGEANEEK